MTPSPAVQLRPAGLWRGSWRQRVRLASGLILFAFAGTHFANHALGLVSLDVMRAAEGWRTAVTRSLPGTVVLAGALLAHVALAFEALADRRSLRMPVWQAAQILLGLAIPFLLVPHILGTRVTNLVTGQRTDYPHVIAHLWPDGMVRQTLLLGLVWAHGCLGLHQWLRLAAGYRRIVPLLAVAALLLPLAATLGIAVQGQFMDRDLAAAERFGAPDLARFWEARPTPEAVSALRAPVLAVVYAAAAGALALGGWRIAAAWRARRIVVTYSTGQSVRAAEGQTLLDISRSARIPHVAVCGGRGRCSTCRVLVTQGGQNLDPPGPAEAATLAAIAAPPGVRL
ncbi:MAG: (2Fe-2S)-binding protein, partial [Methylobacterium sp.]|uniref:2Fe-2S iron-sulfur cluster-binding protein n=1 Tax=Methylobacterium sp. TaxID=409 RepID=UPI002582F819